MDSAPSPLSAPSSPRALLALPFVAADGRARILWRVLLVIFLFLFSQGLGEGVGMGLVGHWLHAPVAVAGLVSAALSVALLTVLLLWERRRVDRRPPGPLGLPRGGRDVRLALLGFGVGGAMLLLLAFVELEAGWARYEGWRGGTAAAAVSVAVGMLLRFGAVGFCEELTFRGSLLRQLNERQPLWLATLLCGVIFGLLHLLNRVQMGPRFIVSSMLMTAFLVGARQRTGSLAFAMGWHAAWDTFQTLIGISGPEGALLSMRLVGPRFWVGQAPMIEDSGLVIGLVALAFGALFFGGKGRVAWGATDAPSNELDGAALPPTVTS